MVGGRRPTNCDFNSTIRINPVGLKRDPNVCVCRNSYGPQSPGPSHSNEWFRPGVSGPFEFFLGFAGEPCRIRSMNLPLSTVTGACADSPRGRLGYGGLTYHDPGSSAT